MTDFIEVYPDALDAVSCRRLVEQFEASGQATRGRVGSGIDTALKDSYDIPLDGSEWQPLRTQLVRTAAEHVKRYVRTYPHLLVGALSPRVQNAQTGEAFVVAAEDLAEMEESRFANLLGACFRFGPINLQKYLAGRGGYPHWHSEIYPRDTSCETLHRVLLYTFYLNDVPEAGETEFLYQGRKVAPRAGSLLIAPAGFTHTHRGNTPVGGDKYIATSWVLFQRAETMYGLASASG